MENFNSIKISIPKPCHEDWNKMTPNEQGSFCGKCCKTVVDFTNKTPDEIKNTLLEQSGKKVCGRFMTDQLGEIPNTPVNFNVPLYSLPKNISYSRAFALALFFAFGTTLFSCTTSENHTVGDITIVDTAKTATIKIDTVKKEKILLGDTVLTVPKKNVMGQARVCTPLKGDVAVEHMTGEVAINTDTVKTVIQKDTTYKMPVMGKVKMSK